MPLHIDKRPVDLPSFVGNEAVKTSLDSVFTREVDRPHTVLFTGPSGCGKTTLARIVANMIGCEVSAIQEYNMANTRGIDTIRELADNSQFGALIGNVKVYLIDECHKLTTDAQNALLKLLEEPPDHVYFILCTTNPEKLIKTIRTRCMTFEVRELPDPLIKQLVKSTIASEGIEDYPEAVINQIVKSSEGCPRQAMILLDQVIDILDEQQALSAVAAANATTVDSMELNRLLISTRKGKWNDARFLLKGLSSDHETLRYGILGYMAVVLISDTCSNPDHISNIIDCFSESFMYSGKAGLYNAIFQACKL